MFGAFFVIDERYNSALTKTDAPSMSLLPSSLSLFFHLRPALNPFPWNPSWTFHRILSFAMPSLRCVLCYTKQLLSCHMLVIQIRNIGNCHKFPMLFNWKFLSRTQTHTLWNKKRRKWIPKVFISSVLPLSLIHFERLAKVKEVKSISNFVSSSKQQRSDK